jgi:GrpB-like predicted nucleotidyltransferase (UPF0157 family)
VPGHNGPPASDPRERMTSEELGRLYPIFLVSYDERWPELFIKEKARLSTAFTEDLRIEHIGSTAVPGLEAKPTIDILFEQPAGRSAEEIIAVLQEYEYYDLTDHRDHLMFIRGYGLTGLEKESYHIHMAPFSREDLWDRVYFRDWLRRERGEAAAYEQLKRRLAARFPHDREAYTKGKAEYVEAVTKKAKAALAGG